VTQYSPELPFLPELSLLRHATQATNSPSSQPNIFSDGVLLAFKALTVFFQHGQPESGNRFVTSDLYAITALNHVRDVYGAVPLETIQTLLMIGYYRFFVRHSPEGIAIIRRAIEHAIASGYQHGQNEAIDPRNDRDQIPYGFPISEIRRRTFWSCFILDSYVCWMADRPQSIRPHELRLQLPCTERTFLSSRDIHTRLLQEDDENYKKRIEDNCQKLFEIEEGEVSLFIRMVDLCGKILSTTRERRCI
jgi:hypothetical protein